jgi:glycosyltransferase involved in cell wall biosynthesis
MLPLVRRYFPRATLVYDAEALFCLRDFRQAELDGRPVSEEDQKTLLREELDIMKPADVVMTVSPSERDVIVREGAHPNVVVWGHARDVHEPVTPFARRHDLLFVGGFAGRHSPNTDAVVHFATTLFPRIRERLPHARFVVVGVQPPSIVQDLASPHVVVSGYVEDLTEPYERCRVFVAPLRFGAGISLKLLEAMSYGLPAVVSPVGAAGLDLRDGREALIAQSDDQFVDKVVQLYEDASLWTTVQSAAQEYIKRECAPDVMRGRLTAALRAPTG